MEQGLTQQNAFKKNSNKAAECLKIQRTPFPGVESSNKTKRYLDQKFYGSLSNGSDEVTPLSAPTGDRTPEKTISKYSPGELIAADFAIGGLPLINSKATKIHTNKSKAFLSDLTLQSSLKEKEEKKEALHIDKYEALLLGNQIENRKLLIELCRVKNLYSNSTSNSINGNSSQIFKKV